MVKSSTIEDVLKAAITSMGKSGSDSPALDAAVLLCHVLDKPRSYLLTWPERELSETEQGEFSQILDRRLAGEPVAYITGEREFWSLPLSVSPSTLIPRPDTERLVELALDKMPASPANILDLGTGTGAIALALASECPQHKVFGIDLREEARELAQSNAEKLAIRNVQFFQGSWFEPLKHFQSEQGTEFALIVSNPPYIDKEDPHLKKGDVRFEPVSALVAEEKGLADIRHIAENARSHLQKEGWLMVEHGYEQAREVRELFSHLGYQNVFTGQDYAGNDRVTCGQYLNY